ncbi:MAG: sigma-70 family RNA polymerase sigma factor, partial [Bacteroidota bacterium]
FEMGADHLVQQSEANLFEKLILESLPPKRLLVFRLHRLEGFSYKEIAKILSISENTVHKHMVAAIKQLADQYPVWKDILLSLLICFAFS